MGYTENKNNGQVYFCPQEVEFTQEQSKYLDKLQEYNQTKSFQKHERYQWLQNFLGSAGKDLYIEPPFYAAFGKNTHFGDGCYVNFNLTLIDDGDIYIGDKCMIANNVTICTTGHPIEPDLRLQGGQYSKTIIIGNNVWLGAGVIVLPGIKIGDNSVIGAGSVVTKDIPENVVAFGNPCKVQRKIS